MMQEKDFGGGGKENGEWRTSETEVEGKEMIEEEKSISSVFEKNGDCDWALRVAVFSYVCVTLNISEIVLFADLTSSCYSSPFHQDDSMSLEAFSITS
jgi:hypothetical protein